MAETNKEFKAVVTIKRTRKRGQLYIEGQKVSGDIAKFLVSSGRAKEVK